MFDSLAFSMFRYTGTGDAKRALVLTHLTRLNAFLLPHAITVQKFGDMIVIVELSKNAIHELHQSALQFFIENSHAVLVQFGDRKEIYTFNPMLRDSAGVWRWPERGYALYDENDYWHAMMNLHNSKRVLEARLKNEGKIS